jgi:hypothetical protein
MHTDPQKYMDNFYTTGSEICMEWQRDEYTESYSQDNLQSMTTMWRVSLELSAQALLVALLRGHRHTISMSDVMRKTDMCVMLCYGRIR